MHPSSILLAYLENMWAIVQKRYTCQVIICLDFKALHYYSVGRHLKKVQKNCLKTKQKNGILDKV